ncbi:ferritin-like domain-containing protein [Bacillus sp. V59.32b]|uniref:ferritin-like domain-containing protein n=1 Tax=Bacillus sp. V59.32b TaxID=1758642 RepID=UPI000E3BCE08|nr:ferritin-like domain-containing protein [Bacillus sp. V59.32b]RFU67615.1 ferritin-like domain-containing protein [Bacillus sp. V59.32b]
MYYDYSYPFSRQPDNLAGDVLKAINGEFNAIQCYNKLLKIVSTEKEKEVIREIIIDENNHLEKFTQIYYNLAGRQPEITRNKDCPKGIKEIFEFAFEDEQETTDFYLDIADQSEDVRISEVFTRASADEQNHAVWFLYFLTKPRL